jgi:hypothetical protein
MRFESTTGLKHILFWAKSSGPGKGLPWRYPTNQWRTAAILPAWASVALCVISGAAFADDTLDHSTNLGAANFGTLDEHAVCGAHIGDGFCGPTAATNSFTYLQQVDPYIGKKLIPTTPLATADALAQKYMNTDANGLTRILSFIQGKENYFSDQHVAADFAAQVDPGNLSPANQAAAAKIPGTTVTAPTGIFLADELARHEDVEILANQVNGDGSVNPNAGHYVTVVDLNWYDTNDDDMIDAGDVSGVNEQGTPSFGYIDPNGGVFRDNINLSEKNGHIYLIGPTTGKLFEITAIVSESPTPEPVAWALMLLGFGFVGAAMRNNHRKQAVVTM